ncbi:hypothetical protein BBBOND_0110110 [Babesia bigemina]|uniref:Uncharacterized protein n=1 Tax=Babesia bigemina TaxID=5866 RepID=A0A061D270_BABBI|nr:hypothetical protein BBBOND_0110110 [Babesia bigemina]CDR94713.1 hypothetical protein BBBOND_0110110 [Babesia bigemina]|eukprot:XP_012766899.1 hypothetical protein BBBOND_0110110 [Babesia bigemina]
MPQSENFGADLPMDEPRKNNSDNQPKYDGAKSRFHRGCTTDHDRTKSAINAQNRDGRLPPKMR